VVEYEGNNFSKYIESLIVKGYNSQLEGDDEKLKKISQLVKELEELRRDTHQLKLQLARAKGQKEPGERVIYED
jgi:hypothetical protein